jgi:chromosomal replication initiator protein
MSLVIPITANAWILPGLKPDPNTRLIGKLDPQEQLEHVIKTVLEYRGQTESEVICKSRKRERVFSRQLICYLAKRRTKCTLKFIGERLHGRDHTTVIHSEQTIMDLMDTDPDVVQTVKELQMLL